ncbi:MAG: hypothetical protein NTU47_00310 [Ignavibacteriales bacterium]|nr:hypothetical protein [Ignavibacteriales bacterium]
MQTRMFRLRSVCVLLAALLLAEPLAASSPVPGEDIAVKNVRFELSGKTVIVSYDLAGSLDQAYLIKVTLKRRQVPGFEYVPKSLSGDVGEGKFSGVGRKVHWDMLRDYPNGLEGDDYYFRIEATMISQSSNLLYYVGGGVAVVGAVVYLLIHKPSVDEGAFPQPSGRPSGY